MEYESSDPKQGHVYVERFEVSEYDGSYTELEDLIEDLTGVFEASVELNKHAHPQDLIEGNAGITIIYDTLETDRTQICLYVKYLGVKPRGTQPPTTYRYNILLSYF